jgi:hypothetical protein
MTFHRKASQSWAIGATVRVGFIADLEVVAKLPTPGDYAPDRYALRSPAGAWYQFTPHQGLRRAADRTDAMNPQA